MRSSASDCKNQVGGDCHLREIFRGDVLAGAVDVLQVCVHGKFMRMTDAFKQVI